MWEELLVLCESKVEKGTKHEGEVGETLADVARGHRHHRCSRPSHSRSRTKAACVRRGQIHLCDVAQAAAVHSEITRCGGWVEAR